MQVFTDLNPWMLISSVLGHEEIAVWHGTDCYSLYCVLPAAPVALVQSIHVLLKLSQAQLFDSILIIAVTSHRYCRETRCKKTQKKLQLIQ